MYKYQFQIDKDSFIREPSQYGIEIAEMTYKRKLLPEYIDFLGHYNAAVFEDAVRIDAPDGKVFYISRFLGIYDEEDGDTDDGDYNIITLINNTSAYFFRGEESRPLIPFALLTNDDTLCFDYREDPAAPRIVQWSWYESKDFAPVTTPFADSFDECLRIIAAAQQNMYKYQFEIEEDSFLGEPGEEGIAVAEMTYHRKLIPEYLEFLKYYNGASIEYSAFTGPNGETIHIERFLAVLDDVDTEEGGYDISAFIANTAAYFIDENYDPTKWDYEYEGPEEYPYIPFVLLANDNTLCFDYRSDPDNPSIALWDKRASEDFAPVTTPFADSFDALMQMIQAAQESR